jgi:hypothetical protein
MGSEIEVTSATIAAVTWAFLILFRRLPAYNALV